MPAPAPATTPPHVLYVEDDRINIILMEEVFRRLPGDWRLECAEDGAQALQLLEELRPALVMIDMHLPDMDGLTLLGRLRGDARLRDLRCIALSADDDPADIAAARAAGFVDYWLKPIDVARLREALEASLR
ncbi:response regulator [Roseateles violae]|uniref:Response regulator n=1 Tax=Roseateles violae TaxID=3058042 RepID=A0ABT8DRJ3_9BURK|nr:response regulator [Pelomonas sp. PFR6]MDN3918914.1 response regulator [Pelomonas sp. PFR6]